MDQEGAEREGEGGSFMKRERARIESRPGAGARAPVSVAWLQHADVSSLGCDWTSTTTARFLLPLVTAYLYVYLDSFFKWLP